MKNMPRQIIIISLIAFIILIYLTLALQIANSQKIAWGLKIANLSVGRCDFLTSKRILEKQWEQFASQEIAFLYQGQRWSTNLADLGFAIDYQATISQAYQIGHQSNIFINFKEQLAALVGYYNLEPVHQIDYEKFQNQTTELFKTIEKPAQNATLVFNEEIDDFSLQHATKGIAVNRKKLLADLAKRIRFFSVEPVELELTLDYPTVENNEVNLAKQKAKTILANQSYQLILEKTIYTLKQKELLDWLKFEPVQEENSDNKILGLFLDEEKVKSYLEKIAQVIDRPATNAQLKTESNRAVIFIPHQNGYEVKKQATFQKLTENILASPPIKKTTIIADKALPQIYLSQTNQLGINSLVGQGVSNFAGSPKNRIHNIKIGAAKFDGLILNPGEEFSYNNLLGGSGPEQGFLPELVIKKDKTTPEYGGGLCQISTTFFRTAVNSGLKITARTPHAFPVEYYYPHGFDATVYEPNPDLKFINNTPGHVLIQTKVLGTQIIINFYGTNDGRVIKIKGPYVLEKKEDGSMKTVFYQKVYLDEELTEEQTFYSNYKSPDLYPVEDSNSE